MLLLFLSEFVRASLLVSLLPTLVTVGFRLPLDVAAFAISAHYLMDTLGRSPAGWLIDRFGARRVTGAGMAIALGALLLVATAAPTSPLWAYLALYGVGTSPLWPSVITTATLGREDNRGGIIGGIFALWLVAIGVGPMLMTFLLPDHLKAAILLVLAVQLVALAAARILPARGPHLAVALPGPALWRRIREIRVLFPGMFAQTMTVGLLLPVLNTFLRHILGLTGLRYGELLAVGGGLAVLLMVPVGALTDRFGERLPLAAGFLMAGGALIVLGQVRSFWPAASLAAVIGIAYALILPSWNSLLASTVDAGSAGSLWGVFMTVEGLGLTLGPVLGARAWDILPPEGPFLLAGLILAAMSLFYALYPLDRLRREMRP